MENLSILKVRFECDSNFVEFKDHIEVNGVILEKPFVEKPVNAEDHNICISDNSTALNLGYLLSFERRRRFCSTLSKGE